MPEGSLIISILREGGGFVPKAETTIERGDEVLIVLDPGLEDEITQPDRRRRGRRWLTARSTSC